MEGLFSFVGIVIIVFGILQIILFFKVWGMTNDVSEMKKMMELFLRKELQQKKEQASVSSKTSIVSIPTKSERGWSKDINEEDKNKAQSIIPNLKKGEIIIKSIKNNKIIVYNEDDLHELADEEYKVIYN